MRIITKASYVWSDRQGRHILVSQKSINWTGRVEFAKGASSQMTNLANSQANFTNQLMADFGTQFANQNNILSTLNKSLSPIVNAGPNQFGFSGAEVNALNSQALQGGAQSYANASRALKESQAAQGGGNTLLPSGVANQQQAALGAAEANNQSNALLGIQQEGYATGRQQYNNAIGQLGGVASQYNPAGFAGQATGAGSSAFNSATQVQQMNNAASPWNLVGGILGGAASSFLGPLMGGLAGDVTGGGGGGSGSVNGGASQAPYGANSD
jgi:hypothetical protein